MFKYGLKLWATNDNYIKEAIELYRANIYLYIELFVVPGTNQEHLGMWCEAQKESGVSFVVHAPHSLYGLNLARRENLAQNMALAKETFKIADTLNTKIVIFHPGTSGKETEVVSQLKNMFDKRIVIENMPAHSIRSKDEPCCGYLPQKIKYIMQETGVGFCLDVSHAICAANMLGVDKINFIKEFVALKPKLYHLSDGDYNGTFDQHLSFSKGSFDPKAILKLIPNQSMITIETEKRSKENLSDFVEDMKYIKVLEKSS